MWCLMQVCFYGDSHMRHLHNLVIGLLGDHASATTFVGGHTMKAVLNASHFQYVEDNWGGVHDTAHCGYVFTSFGQWAVAHTAGAMPWSLRRYAGEPLIPNLKPETLEPQTLNLKH